jgi:hypothetical protein
VLGIAACGGSGDKPIDGNSAIDTPDEHDAAIDARPPNTTHRGLVQFTRINGTTGPSSIGFYEVPDGAPGCTWTFEGACSLQLCEDGNGLAAVSAGDVTITVNGTAMMSTPSGAVYPSVSLTGSAGMTMSATAVGATVPAFTSSTITLVDQLTDIVPANMTSVDHTLPLAVAWTAAPGRFYVNISQTPNTGPFPSGFRTTIRCEGDAQSGSVTIPASIMGGLSPAMMNPSFSVANMAATTLDAGDYEVTVRALALQMSSRLVVQ